MYTFPSGVHWDFRRFWILYDSFGGPQWSHCLARTSEIQNAWFSARFVEYGSSSDPFLWKLWFSAKLPWLPDTVFIVFSARVLPNMHFRGFGSRPKRCAAKRYADSWWYHLEKCPIWLFHTHLRFSISGHFWKPLPFVYLNSGSVVFTKFGHQPYVLLKTIILRS